MLHAEPPLYPSNPVFTHFFPKPVPLLSACDSTLGPLIHVLFTSGFIPPPTHSSHKPLLEPTLCGTPNPRAPKSLKRALPLVLVSSSNGWLKEYIHRHFKTGFKY